MLDSDVLALTVDDGICKFMSPHIENLLKSI